MDIRKVSSKARVTLPKEFADKFVCVEKIGEGFIQIKSGEFMPVSERMFHTDEYKKRLDRFDRWLDNHVPEESDPEKICERLTK
ncbi:MAG TPA: hypothetical protein DCQ37_18115 [Desulfobacteraceae bacterium]|nr:hypothetical protein [Desulfobacteraceae bacterium]